MGSPRKRAELYDYEHKSITGYSKTPQIGSCCDNSRQGAVYRVKCEIGENDEYWLSPSKKFVG